MDDIYLSIGSNTGSRVENIKSALKLLAKISDIKKISPFYITQPMYYTKQPYFINCAVKISTSLSPEAFLKKIFEIEKKLGRVRLFKHAPRTLDIDIVYWNKKIIDTPSLKIPHPYRAERLFVLKPLNDISPDFIDPVTGKKINTMLKKIPFGDITKVPENYEESLSFISELKPRNKNDFKTDYIKQTLSLINDPQDRIGRVIHITGSEGKTSTAFYIYRILKRYYKTALYTSPHIMDIRERIIFNGEMISKTEFHKHLINVISNSVHLHSAFEYLTLIALSYFSEKKPQFSVIEVGMGGELDATNVFKSSYCVLTHITKEHTKYLGRTIKEIIDSKCGIIKENSKVFISSQNSNYCIKRIAENSIKKKADFFIFDKTQKDPQKFNFIFSRWICSKILNKEIKINFFPLHLIARNYKIIYKNHRIILDGAHTPYSIKKLMNNINTDIYQICLCSFMKDKDIKNCLKEIIKKNFKKIILTKSMSKRTFNPEIINTNDKRVLKIKDLQKAFRYALSYQNICVCGSLYFCGDIISILKKEKRIYINELI